MQQTLAAPVEISGRGLHTGAEVTLRLKPAEAGAGWVFVRTDLSGSPEIHPGVGQVARTQRGTTLRENGADVHTVEHVLAALAGLRIDNCRLELNGPEPPAADGSALPFVEACLQAGVRELGEPVHSFRLPECLVIAEGGKEIVAWPAEGLTISYCLEYDHGWIPSQRVDVEVTPENFRARLAPARTYCFEHEIAWLKSQGLAQGGDEGNALVFSESGLRNGPVRFDHEPAYHKVLDVIGDLALLGFPVEGHFVFRKSGHELNVRLAEALERLHKETATKQRRDSHVTIEAKEIEKILPHRYPMLLVDRVIDLEEGKRVVGIKNVTINEPFFSGHFPGHPIMPGVLIIEAMAQCGGVLLMKSLPEPQKKVVYFVSIDQVKFRKPVLPGDQLRFVLEVDKIKAKIAKMRGKAFVGEELVCEADLMSTIMDR